MKPRKLLTILLTLALLLGIAPLAGASGAVEGQSTTFQSTTVTEETDATSTNKKDDIEVKLISVTITNIYDIQANPYGMIIKTPDGTGTSDDSIVTVPMRIENRSGVKMQVTASATAIPEGDVALDDKPTRYAYIHDPLEDPSKVPSEERVYLYMEMKGQDKDGNPLTTDPAVITKEGGSSPITVFIPKNTGSDATSATLQIFGDTSLPTYYGSWHRGNGFKVNVVLSFMPIQDEPGYTVSFDAIDSFWEIDPEYYGLIFPVHFLVYEDPSKPKLDESLPEGHLSSGTALSKMEVSAEKNLTFTIKTADAAKGHCYAFDNVTLIREDGTEEVLYQWQKNKTKLVEYTSTINAAQVKPGEKLTIRARFTEVNIA